VSVNPVDVKVRAQVDPGSTPKVLGFAAAGVVVATGVAVGPAVIVRVFGGPGRRGPTMPRSSFRSRDRGALLFQGAAASPAALRRLRRRHGTAFRTELIEPADRIPTLGGAIGVRNRGHISPPLSAAPSRSAPSCTRGGRPRCGSATRRALPGADAGHACRLHSSTGATSLCSGGALRDQRRGSTDQRVLQRSYGGYSDLEVGKTDVEI
jgi:hypothetical protein